MHSISLTYAPRAVGWVVIIIMTGDNWTFADELSRGVMVDYMRSMRNILQAVATPQLLFKRAGGCGVLKRFLSIINASSHSCFA